MKETETSIPKSEDHWFRRLRRRLYRLYYRAKYVPFAAERRARHEADQRGFVVVQIDALAHDDLQRALRRGYMPQIQRLMDREAYELRRYPAGLPSATPAAQAAIFHGTKARIPAFRWYEKGARKIIVGSQRDSMQFIRDRLPEDGVLRGGSSYVNLYDGGAARSVFTLAARETRPLFEQIGGGRLLLLLLLHPFRLARMALVGVLEYLREEKDRLLSQIRGESTYYWWYLPLLHIGANVVLRELQTLAVLLDIYTGAPVIYTTYNTYDEFAHHFGPSSETALKNLRALDRRLGEILRMTRRLPGRPYDVIILSDHGQTPAVPYRIRYGETLGDTIVAAQKHGVHVLAGTGTYAPATEAIQFLATEVEEISATSSRPTRSLGLRFTRWLREAYSPFPLVAENVRVSDEQRLVVTYSSSLAHVYWTDPAHPIGLDEIRADDDRRALYYFLVAHEGIGLVITRMLDGAHVESQEGRAIVMPDGEMEVIKGQNPLEDYADVPAARRAIVHLATLPNAGDLVLIGAYDPAEDLCVCFDDQVGAHGGIGGRQFWPFLLSPPDWVPEGRTLQDPLDLHPLLDRYTRQEPAPNR
ncbi:MAG: alkaline phosphatase family protein [Longimicrobiales bacterium]